MVSENVLGLDRLGFSLAELIVVMALTGLVAATSAPWLISYWRSATLRAAAEELAAGLNRARHLAISQNQSVCIEVAGTRYRYRLGGCGGTIWRGPGTDASGLYGLANNVTLATNASPVFDYLGAATGATFTVTNPPGATPLKVVVSASGRVQITH